uniref:G-protein coupled receptors family 1 profile domain-containing protein n=1 Tax=Globodera rostochiensis TaxID=31243 RepID=A0A914GTZ8_GLORO
MWTEKQSPTGQSVAVGCLYIGIGLIGLVLNVATCVMIASKRVYRLSAYTIMANVALADCAMLIVAGLACGCALIMSPTAPFLANNASGNAEVAAVGWNVGGGSFGAIPRSEYDRQHLLYHPDYHSDTRRNNPDFGKQNPSTSTLREAERRIPNNNAGRDGNEFVELFPGFLNFGIAFGEIASWSAGVLSYAYLGINRY